MCGKHIILRFLFFLNIILELRGLSWMLFSRFSLTTAEKMCKSNGDFGTSVIQSEFQPSSQCSSCGAPGYQVCACVHIQRTWAINSLSGPGIPVQTRPWTDLGSRTYFSLGESQALPQQNH